MIKIILKAIFAGYQILGRLYLIPIFLRERKRPVVNCINERSIEFGFTLRWLSKICPVEVLDVGSGVTAWPHIIANCGFRVTAIDKKGGSLNRHYYIRNDDITRPKITGQFDLITCISVLEHIPDHKAAINGIFRLLKPGGYLVLTFPYSEKHYVNNVYKLPNAGYGQNAPHICQVFSRKEIDTWLSENPGEIIVQEYYEVFSGDLWTFGKRIYPPHKVKREERHHLSCVLIQKSEEGNGGGAADGSSGCAY